MKKGGEAREGKDVTVVMGIMGKPPVGKKGKEYKCPECGMSHAVGAPCPAEADKGENDSLEF